MKRRVLALTAALILLTAACSDSADPSGGTSATTSGTSTPLPSTTSAVTTTPPIAGTQPSTSTDPVAGTPGSAGLGDDYFPLLGNGGYDALRYLIDLTIDPAVGSLDGTVTMTARAVHNLSSFNLDFRGPEIESVVVDGAAAGFSRDGGELIVTPVKVIESSADFTVAITYAGVPEPIQSAAIPFPIGWRNTPTALYTASEPDASNGWYPVNDHPLDKATYTFRLTVPEPLFAVANGLLTEIMTGEGTIRYTWVAADPMASYLTLIAVADLVEVLPSEPSPVVLRSYLPPDLAASPPDDLDRLPEMMEFFSGLFGPYPHDAFGIVVVDEFETALETQTLSIFSREIAESVILDRVLVHELAHEWFGNDVSPADWSDIWLNEGFATYAEWLWQEREGGAAGYRQAVARAHTFATVESLAGPGEPGVAALFGASVYVRGGLTLHALRSEVGDDVFFAILRAHHAGNARSATTTEEFIALAEQISARDLDSLFDAWLLADEVPPLP